MARKLKIAILGTRGIPANYGGFETFAEELATRLVAMGHHVSVYCRHPFFEQPKTSATYRGVQLISTPTVMHKYLETPLHALTSFLDLFKRDFDVLLLCNAANAPFAFIPRLLGFPIAINVDGIESRRQKWNFLGKLWYKIGERAAVLFATRIIADAKVIADYYWQRYASSSQVITYGATANPLPPGKILEKYSLTTANYILYVSRLEPENNAKGVIQAYVQSKLDMPLVIVGDAPYAAEYKAELKALANNKVIFTGFQFAEAYRELRTNCYCYIQATEVGGTHPALVEAMAYGNCIIANDTPEHREVLDQAGLYYAFNNFDELTKLLIEVIRNKDLSDSYSTKARARAGELYNWQRITGEYEELFWGMVREGSRIVAK